MEPLPILDARSRCLRNFRNLLQAMSRPGQLFHLDVRPLFYAFPAMAIAECLMDHEVSFNVAGQGASKECFSLIMETTGAQPAAMEAADFLFLFGAGGDEALHQAKRGTAACPDASATLIYSMDSRQTPDNERLHIRLKGPGIAAPDGIAPEMSGLDLDAIHQLSQINRDYPKGVDAIFVQTTGELICLPRSTRIEVI